MDRREPDRRGAPWPVRGGRARLEPQALRRRVRGTHLAEGVRRRRRSLQPPGDLPRGDGARGGAFSPRGDRARNGRPDDHRPRNRGAEEGAPRCDPLDRRDLVPGLLRAGRRLRSRRRPHEREPGRRPLRRQRPEGVVVVRAHRRLVHPRHAERSRLAEPRGPDLPDRGHALARRRGAAAAPDHRRGGVQRDLLHRRQGAGRERARRGRRRLGGRDDDAAARARNARLRADRGTRGADPEADRARQGARGDRDTA